MTTAAECLLASTLWTSELGVNQSSKTPTAPSRLATRCPKIDNALCAGLDVGRISCISGEDDAGAREVSQALLVSQLLRTAYATATVIDTGSAVDVRKLNQALTAQGRNRGDAAAEAMKALERMKIMKVFDFVGLTECIAELRDDLEGKNGSSTAAIGEREVPRSTVGDSEDEEDFEILDSPALQPNATSAKSEPTLLVIDNIAQVVAPLLKTNYIQGQAVLASFMRSLLHLTKAHRTCTLLINGVTSNPNAKDEVPSIFSSCKLQPSLGRAFTYALDMHLLIHRMQRTTSSVDGHADGNEVSVIEVLHDRHGNRTGNWAAFTIDDAGNLKDIA